MEPFAAKVVKTLPRRVQVVTLQGRAGVKLLSATHRCDLRRRRTSGQAAGHDHEQRK